MLLKTFVEKPFLTRDALKIMLKTLINVQMQKLGENGSKRTQRFRSGDGKLQFWRDKVEVNMKVVQVELAVNKHQEQRTDHVHN